MSEMEISCSETIGYSVIELVCSKMFNVLPVVDNKIQHGNVNNVVKKRYNIKELASIVKLICGTISVEHEIQQVLL